MAQMIRTAGKAYSVFDAAKLVLASGERFRISFHREGENAEKFFTVPADESVWLTRDEAVAHLMQSESALSQLYRREEVELEEPKGNFTSVAICGFSGELIGPPSHHSYQFTLRRIHHERFANMPFEDYKRRVRTDSTPEAVEKWKESQKHGVQWVDLKAEVPEGGEAPRFKTRTEMESHFRANHAAALLGEATSITVAGNIPKQNLSAPLYHALRRAVDEARKHPLPTAQLLCSGFEKAGLKLFKRRGGKLWVSRVRPKLLDSSVVLSAPVAKLLEIIKAKPGISVKELLETFAPGEPDPAKAEPAPAAETSAAELEPAAPAEAVTEAAPVESAPSPLALERMAALKDLHWLNSEGYVTEYSDGVVFIGVTEPPPAKPKAVKEPAPEESASAESAEVTNDEPAAATDEETSVSPPTAAAEEQAPAGE